jgi:hypothetical protein
MPSQIIRAGAPVNLLAYAAGSEAYITSTTNYAYGTCSPSPNGMQLTLKSKGFTIPANAVIAGIKVTFYCYANVANEVWVSIRLFKGAGYSTDRGATTPKFTTSPVLRTYGSATDLWGLTWTPADINATSFGIAYYIYTTSYGAFAYTNYMTTEVYYNEPNKFRMII